MRGRVIWLLLVIVLPAVALAETHYSRLYRSGRQAVKEGYYRTAVFLLLDAVKQQPEAGGPWVKIYGRNRVPYLPYYYLGAASYELGEYGKAAAAWERSEKGGAVRDAEEWKSLLAYKELLQNILPEVFESARFELAAAKEAVSELATTLPEVRLAGFEVTNLESVLISLQDQELPVIRGLLVDGRRVLLAGKRRDGLALIEKAREAAERVRVTAIGYTNQAYERLAGPDVRGVPQTDLYDGMHALLLGVSAYRNGWPILPGVREDLESLERVLQRKGFKVNKVIDPNKREFQSAVARFIDAHGRTPRKGRQNRNLLLIYFAGHGTTLKRPFLDEGLFKEGYLMPVDAPLTSADTPVELFEEVAISMDKVTEWATDIESLHAVFMLDVCFAGSIFNAVHRRRGFSLAEATGLEPVIAEKLRQPARLFIASGNEDQEAMDRSMFRRLFEEVLTGRAFADYTRNGFLEGSELCIFLESKVYHATNRQQMPQCGRMASPYNKGDVVFTLSTKTVNR